MLTCCFNKNKESDIVNSSRPLISYVFNMAINLEKPLKHFAADVLLRLNLDPISCSEILKHSTLCGDADVV
jgi:hypothetical protein